MTDIRHCSIHRIPRQARINITHILQQRRIHPRGFMKKATCLILCLCCALPLLFAQEAEEPQDTPQENIEVLDFKPIRAGDKYMKIGIGLGVPLFNTSNKKFAIPTKMYPGPKILLGMHFYVTDGLSLGGDLNLEFYTTIGKNLLFELPLQFTVAYTLAYKRWRFPMGIGIGGAVLSYLESKAFGLYINPFFSFYYQYNPEWSFGGELNWAISSEFRKNNDYSRAHNNLGISFVVRYHY